MHVFVWCFLKFQRSNISKFHSRSLKPTSPKYPDPSKAWRHFEDPKNTPASRTDSFTLPLGGSKRGFPITDPWDWYIYLHEWLMFMIDVGKYTLHDMDPLGLFCFFFCSCMLAQEVLFFVLAMTSFFFFWHFLTSRYFCSIFF